MSERLDSMKYLMMEEDKDLFKADLKTMLIVVGSYLYAGENLNQLEDVDTDVIMKLRELTDDELEYRATGIPKDTQIH